FLLAAHYRGRIRYAPVRGHRLARPQGTGLAGRVVAYREHEVQGRSARLSELVPALRAQAFGLELLSLQQLQRERIYFAGRMAAGAECTEAAGARSVQIGLGEDRSRRVARAEEQDVVQPGCHFSSRKPWVRGFS